MKGQKENKYSNSHRFWATFFVVVLFGLASLLSRVSAATYDQFTFQARLLSKDKQSAPSGSYNFRFTIYNSSSGGTQLWQETVNSVAVDYGKFTTTLGAGTSLSGVDFSSANLYLAVEFDSDGNGSFDQSFSERMPLTAVPVAQNANRLGGKAESAFASLSEDEIITGAYIFQNTLTAQGSLSAQGNIALGNDSGDLINFGGRVNSTIEPNQTATHDLGSSANKFKTAYLTNLSVTDTVTLASSLNGLLKVTAGAVSTATVDTDFQQVVTWGDGLEYSGSTASIDYNATNLKITATELNTIQDIAITSTPQFGGLTVGSVGTQQVASTLKVDGLATIGSSSANSAYLHFNRLSSSRYGDGSIGVGSTNAPAMQILMGGYLTNTSTGTATANVYDAQSLMTFGIGTTAFGIEKASVTSGNAFTSADFTSLFSVTSAGQVKINIGSSTGGINLGDGAGTYDTNLYRSAANSLKTDDSFLAANLTSAGLTSGRVTYAGTAGILQDSANMTFGATYGLTLAAGSTSALQFSSTAGTAAGGILFGTDTNLYRASSAALATQWSADSNGGPNFVFRKSRGSTGSETIVNSSDTVGSVVFQGYDGSSWVNLATISSAVDATPGSGDMPGVIIFKTTPDGSSTLTEGLRVDSAQKIWIGGSVDTNLYRSAANTLKTDDSLVIAGTSADLLAQGDLRFYDSDSTNYIGFQAPATVGTNLTWTLPDADGGSATVLKTNGSGTLYWDTDNTAGAGSGTLDDAYNNGRTITVDAGPIILNDSGTTTSLFDINQSGAITSTAPLFDVDYSGSINNAADYSAISLTGVTNAGAGSSIGIDLSGFDYSLQVANAMVLSASKAADATDFLSKKPDATGAQFLFDTSATISTASLFAVNNNGSRKLTLAATGDLLPGSDAAQNIGSTGYRWLNGYFSNSLNVGSTLVLTDGAIKDTNSALAFQANNDTTNYVTLSSNGTNLTFTTTNYADLAISPAGALSLQSNNSEPLSLTSSGGTTITENSSGGITLSGDLYVTGTTAATVTSAAVLQWGSSGLSSPDTNLYRSAANTLKTDDSFIVGGSSLTAGSLSFNAATIDTTTVATLLIRSNKSVTNVIDLDANETNQGWSVYNRDHTVASNQLLFVTQAGRLQINKGDSTGGIVFGDGGGSTFDTNLYRSAANTLKTDDAFTATDTLSVTGSTRGVLVLQGNYNGATNVGHIQFQNDATAVTDLYGYSTGTGASASGSFYFRTMNAGTLTQALQIDSTQKLWIGSTADTNLYRSAANILKTDDTFSAPAASIIAASGGSNAIAFGSNRAGDYGGLIFNSSPASAADGVGLGYLDTYTSLTGSRVRAGFLGFSKEGSGTDSKTRLDLIVNNGTTVVSALVVNSSGQMQLPVTGSTGGILIGGDANLYRSAANTLKTDDALTVSTNLSVGTAINSAMALKVDMRSFTNGLYLYADNSDTSVIQIENTDDATAEFVIDSVGKTTWRGDTNLYRSTANTLKTDDSLIVASSLQNDVLAGVGNRAVYSTAAGVLTNSSSDATLKTNVISLTNNINALDTVSQLRGVYYNWLDVNKMGSQREIGLIAQEVQPHLPELIGTNADGTLSIDYPKLTAVLVEAVKQLNTEVEALSGPLMTAEQLTSPASKDLVLTAGSGQIVANSALTINGSLAVAGAFTVKGQGEGDYELDGTEDDTSMTSATERAAVANGQTETVVAIPSQGNNNYSVLVTWLNDPGQPHWVTVVDSEHFKVRFTNAVLADSIFRYLIIDNE